MKEPPKKCKCGGVIFPVVIRPEANLLQCKKCLALYAWIKQ